MISARNIQETPCFNTGSSCKQTQACSLFFFSKKGRGYEWMDMYDRLLIVTNNRWLDLLQKQLSGRPGPSQIPHGWKQRNFQTTNTVLSLASSHSAIVIVSVIATIFGKPILFSVGIFDLCRIRKLSRHRLLSHALQQDAGVDAFHWNRRHITWPRHFKTLR